MKRSKTVERDPEAIARRIETTLLHFSAQRRSLARDAARSNAGWPYSVSEAWRAALSEVEVGYSVTGLLLPKRVLIQTRVAFETELELTIRRHGPAPKDIRGRLERLYVRVAEQMRRPRAPTASTAPEGPGARFVWPVSPIVLTSPFGFRRDPILGAKRVRFHAGVDLGGRRGDVVVAAGPGKVIGAGWRGGHGRTVTIQHISGYVTKYAHLSRILVLPNTKVEAGAPIGLMGSSGRSTGPHLHFEVRRGSVPINPLEVVRGLDSSYATR